MVSATVALGVAVLVSKVVVAGALAYWFWPDSHRERSVDGPDGPS